MGSNEAIRQAVKAGVGISVISRRAVLEDLEQGRLQEIKIKKLPLVTKFLSDYPETEDPFSPGPGI